MPRHTTFADAIANAAVDQPTKGYTFQDMEGKETLFTYPRMAEETAARAAAMQAMGMQKGDRIGLIILEPEDFVLTFLAAIRIGVVPVPLYPPLSFGSLDAYAERTARVLRLSEARLLVASSKLQNVLWSLVDAVPTLERLVKAEEIVGGGEFAGRQPVWPELKGEDLCFLQYTSGSTADPKGVMVTHNSLLANCEGIIEHAMFITPENDVAVSWLPLYHDMGLIGFVLAPLCYAIPGVIIPTVRFIKRPSVWLETIHKHRGTVSFGPNFAYALAAKKAKPEEMARWDLSCVKILGCGAEPIHADTMREFTEQFATHSKLPRNAIMPAYGMAEATLAISLKISTETMQFDTVDVDHFAQTGEARPPAAGAVSYDHVSCGVAFPGHEVAAFADNGERLSDGREGELCVKGPSVTPGYYKNPEATAATFRNGWLHTGDLGYIRNGQVFVTGRIKDLIILNGRNIHPQAVEWAAAEVEGVRKGNVVAFSRPGASSEELVVVLETKEEDTSKLVAAVQQAVRREISVAPVDVVCLKPGGLPKTSSGKLQRRKTREMYLRNELVNNGDRTIGAGGDTVTLARHVARSLWSRAKNGVLSRLGNN
jgi:fatty-acyl-CoA synthase